MHQLSLSSAGTAELRKPRLPEPADLRPEIHAVPFDHEPFAVEPGGDVLEAPGKDTAEVHDYHDPATPILAASLQRRMPGYRALGFIKTAARVPA